MSENKKLKSNLSPSNSLIHAQGLKQLISELPTSPGVYLMKNSVDKIIYVGKAKNLKKRVQSYFYKNHEESVKTQHLVRQIHNLDYLLTPTEVEAFLLEATLIKKHKPKYNIRLKDDKNYPYIKCNIQHEFPRFEMVRKVKRDGSLYFGPFTSSFAVRESIQFIQKHFLLRDCSDGEIKSRTRPCMNHQIHLCTAPCVSLISFEDYQKKLSGALDFIRGNNHNILKSMKIEMKLAAKNERFERAAKLRDSIASVEKIWQKQTVVTAPDSADRDYFNWYGDERGTLIESLHIRSGRIIGHRNYFFNRLQLTDEEGALKEVLISFLNQYYIDNVLPQEIYLPIDLGRDLIKLLIAVFQERSMVSSPSDSLSRSSSSVSIRTITNGESHPMMNMAFENAKNHFHDRVRKIENYKQALLDIQKSFQLKEFPQRIECYDISHFQGEETVASQVVFEEGVPKREDYRKYKLRDVSGVDDYASMKEVLGRRLSHTEYEDPQLILIDGGKGQLNTIVRVLTEMGRTDLAVVALAKARTESRFDKDQVHRSEERFFLPGRQNPIRFRENSLSFKILVQLRDEAHRFAVSFHKQRRDRRVMKTQLDTIDGVGPRLKNRLLKHYKSVIAIQQSSVQELSSIKGVSTALAERILFQLNEDS